jgi:hypothetical protein
MHWRYFQEGLYHRHEYIQIKSNRCADDVDPAPRALHMTTIARQKCDRQHHRRYRAHDVRRQYVLDGEREPSNSSQNCACQEDRCPPVFQLATHTPRQIPTRFLPGLSTVHQGECGRRHCLKSLRPSSQRSTFRQDIPRGHRPLEPHACELPFPRLLRFPRRALRRLRTHSLLPATRSRSLNRR